VFAGQAKALTLFLFAKLLQPSQRFLLPKASRGSDGGDLCCTRANLAALPLVDRTSDLPQT
jgi:hypothetical protein